MAASSFLVGAGPAVLFNWLDHGPQYTKRDNTDVYSGKILLNSAADVVALAALFREIAVEPVDASSGTGFVVDYNGVTDPSGTFTQSDGTTLTAVLSKFTRSVWNTEDHHELQVEFTRTA